MSPRLVLGQNERRFEVPGRKTKWAVSFGHELEKLRAVVVAKLININLQLATHSSCD